MKQPIIDLQNRRTEQSLIDASAAIADAIEAQTAAKAKAEESVRNLIKAQQALEAVFVEYMPSDI